MVVENEFERQRRATATSMRSPRGTQVSETITPIAIFNPFTLLRCRFWSFGVLEFSPAQAKTAAQIGNLMARKVQLPPYYFPNPTIFMVQRLTPPLSLRWMNIFLIVVSRFLRSIAVRNGMSS